jgi:hypothetical protein
MIDERRDAIECAVGCSPIAFGNFMGGRSHALA